MAGKVTTPDSVFDLPFMPTASQLFEFSIKKNIKKIEKMYTLEDYLVGNRSNHVPITSEVSGMFFSGYLNRERSYIKDVILDIENKKIKSTVLVKIEKLPWTKYVLTADGIFEYSDPWITPILVHVTPRGLNTLEKISSKDESIYQNTILLYDSRRIHIMPSTLSKYLKRVISQYKQMGFSVEDSSEKLSLLFRQGYNRASLEYMDTAKQQFINYLKHHLND